MKIEILHLSPVRWMTYGQNYTCCFSINGQRMPGQLWIDGKNVRGSADDSIDWWLNHYMIYDHEQKKAVSGKPTLHKMMEAAAGTADMANVAHEVVEAVQLAVLKYRISLMPQDVKNEVIYGLNQPDIVS